MAEFATGEAVALELPIARIPTRVAAFLLDLVVQIVIAVLLIVLTALVIRPNDTAVLQTIVTVVIVVVLVGYPAIMETLLVGRTLGKLALGLRVVRAGDAGPIDFRQALIRALSAAIVDFWALGGCGSVALVVSLCSPNARRVGDVLADTVVIHDTARVPIPRHAVPAPWLAGWVASLDVAAVPDHLALQVREYLMRYYALTPAVQHDLGTTLTAAVCGYLRIPVPPAIAPIDFLHAVSAERQRRALAQATRAF